MSYTILSFFSKSVLQTLEFFMSNYDREFTVEEVCKLSKKDKSIIYNNINTLIKYDLLKKQKFKFEPMKVSFNMDSKRRRLIFEFYNDIKKK